MMAYRLFDYCTFMTFRYEKPSIFIYVHAESATKEILYLIEGFF